MLARGLSVRNAHRVSNELSIYFAIRAHIWEWGVTFYIIGIWCRANRKKKPFENGAHNGNGRSPCPIGAKQQEKSFLVFLHYARVYPHVTATCIHKLREHTIDTQNAYQLTKRAYVRRTYVEAEKTWRKRQQQLQQELEIICCKSGYGRHLGTPNDVLTKLSCRSHEQIPSVHTLTLTEFSCILLSL